jgi:nitrogen regulatory protein P-II 1
MKELKVYCRRERVDDLVHALRRAGVPRMTVTHVRSLGTGVDPKHAGISWEAGTLYTEKAKLEFVCSEPEVDRLIGVILAQARTGEPGDGIVFASPVDRAVKILSGAEGRDALR